MDESLKDLVKNFDSMFSMILAYLTERKSFDIEFGIKKTEPCKFKQALLRDLKIIDQTNHIIYTIYESYHQLTKTPGFIDLLSKFNHLLFFAVKQNTENTIYLSRMLKYYLKPELLTEMILLINEVVNESEYSSLNFIMEILNTFIYDTSLSYFQPDTQLSSNILKVIIATSKYKTFCLSLQRYQPFWTYTNVKKIFPEFKKAQNDEDIIEIYLKDKKLCCLNDFEYNEEITLQQEYIINSLELIIVLSKNIPNFLRLYSAFSNLIPYNICLSVIEYDNHREFSPKLTKIFLEIIIHFHFKYFYSKKLVWPDNFIKATHQNINVTILTPDEMNDLNEKIVNINQIPEKVKLNDIFNLYRQNLQNLLNSDDLHNNQILKKITNLLDFMCVLLKNKIIKFASKKPYLVFYKELCNLNTMFESKFMALSVRNSSSQAQLIHSFSQLAIVPGVTEQKPTISKLINEILLHINHSIEQFYPFDYLYFMKGNVPLIGNKDENFIQLSFDDLERRDLDKFIKFWDNSLVDYDLSLIKFIEDQLHFAAVDGINFATLQKLESLSSRYERLIEKMTHMVIFENYSEVHHTLQIFTCMNAIHSTIEEYHIIIDLDQKENKLHQIEGLLIKFVRLIDIDLDDAFKEVWEKYNYCENLMNNYNLLAKKTNVIKKFQNALRILKVHEGILEVLDFLVNIEQGFANYDSTLKAIFVVFQILIYFASDNSENAAIIYKLIVSAYFYDLYGKKQYPQELMILLQTLISIIYFTNPKIILKKEDEIKLLEIFFHPFLKDSVAKFYKLSQNDKKLLTSRLISNDLSKYDFEQLIILSFFTNKNLEDIFNIMNKTLAIKYHEFIKQTFQVHFTLLSDYLNNKPHKILENMPLPIIHTWYQFFIQLVKTLIVPQQQRLSILKYLVTSCKLSLTLIIDLILKIKSKDLFELKSTFYRLGRYIYINSIDNIILCDKEQIKMMYIFLNLMEAQ